MILAAILTVILVCLGISMICLLGAGIITAGAVGSVFIFLFADVIVCMVIIGFIIKNLIKKKDDSSNGGA